TPTPLERSLPALRKDARRTIVVGRKRRQQPFAFDAYWVQNAYWGRASGSARRQPPVELSGHAVPMTVGSCSTRCRWPCEGAGGGDGIPRHVRSASNRTPRLAP